MIGTQPTTELCGCECGMPIPHRHPFPSKALEDRESVCWHEWRIIENFHAEFPRNATASRQYAVYCVYCLTSKGIEININ